MKRTIGTILLATLLGSPLLACEEQGPMERAGEKVDEAVDEITNPGEGPLEEAGRKADEAVEDAREELE